MALTHKLEFRQSQALVMTPQLQQAIKLLQLSNLDLVAYIETELERNPLLERADGDAPETADGEASHAGAVEETPADGAATGLGGEDQPLDAEYESLYPEDSAADAASGAESAVAGAELFDWGQGRANGSAADAEFGVEQTVAGAVTLKDHLLGQLNIALLDPVDRLIGANLVECLDEAGYLTEDTAAVADRLGADVERVNAVLGVLQGFDPPGVFARDLAECLALQLKEKDRLDPAMQAVLAHLDLLARHDLPGLMRVANVDAEDLRDIITEIRDLNPKPGLAYDYDVIQPAIPDVFVREGADGAWHVELNTETLPRVLVNSRYFARVNRQVRSKAERGFLTECMNNANWLVKSLDQRARTILRVASELVRQQDEFFSRGVQYLRPLNLKAIAEAIDMHESTVSRVTANKYLATPRGIFEMKYFFTSAIASSEGGEAHSAEAVRHRIRELIENESPDDVLSDDKLVELLRASGIDIARRTVAKYREAMGIASSVQRRRMKRVRM